MTGTLDAKFGPKKQFGDPDWRYRAGEGLGSLCASRNVICTPSPPALRYGKNTGTV